MRIEYLLFIILIIFLFYHFECNCKEGFSQCENKLQELCDNSRKKSVKKCNKCLTDTQNYPTFQRAGCSNIHFKNFCKIKFSPEDDDVEALMTRLKDSLDETSVGNGIFVSMIFHDGGDNIYIDGSGSILFPSLYEKIFYTDKCNFGFLWDTDFLDKNLISCLFPVDSYTTPINNHCKINFRDPYSGDPKQTDVCILAGVSSPDRCTKGLKNTFESPRIMQLYDRDDDDEIPYPTNCLQNVKYQFTEPYNTSRLNEGGNCFRYIVDTFNTSNQSPDILSGDRFTYNEGVFLKNVDDGGIEIHEGLKQLTELNKPKPVALFYAVKNGESIGKCPDYEIHLNKFKLNFTPDTPVIIMEFNENFTRIINISYKLLQYMP
tara:strand:- start:31 stop:1158 length:1128 start_codon:yes stop_codon:yes gene_type:complete